MEKSVGFFHVEERRQGKVPERKNKRIYTTDIWEQWQEDGKLEEVLAFIADCSKKLVTQREMCKYLKIEEHTFTNLKHKYPQIQEAMDKSRYELKKDLANAMYKKAVGYETVDEDQLIEEKDGKTKKKVHRVKKQVGPDFKAITYLLTKKFGKEYSERYEDLRLMEKKLESQNRKEEWSSVESVTEEEHDDSDEERSGD